MTDEPKEPKSTTSEPEHVPFASTGTSTNAVLIKERAKANLQEMQDSDG